MIKRIFIILICFSLTIPGYAGNGDKLAQISMQINAMEKACQSCIDAGSYNFISCETTFYKQMDSLLNDIYKQLSFQMDSAQFEKLKIDQRAWLKKRDAYAKNKDTEIGSSGAGVETDQALAIHQKALFEKERVIELLKALK